MYKWAVLAVSALALITVVGCNTSNLVQGRISGTVYESDSGKTPVAAATVITTKDGVQTGQTETDELGEFEIRDLNSGTHTVTVTKSGYETLSGMAVTVTSGGNAIREFYLDPIKGSISGTVLDNVTFAALPGATVQAYLDGEVAGSATTASDGTYTIEDLDDGSYSVTVSRTGYQTDTKTGIIIANWSAVTSVNFGLSPAAN